MISRVDQVRGEKTGKKAVHSNQVWVGRIRGISIFHITNTIAAEGEEEEEEVEVGNPTGGTECRGTPTKNDRGRKAGGPRERRRHTMVGTVCMCSPDYMVATRFRFSLFLLVLLSQSQGR